MPPQMRGFGGAGAPFSQPSFPSHGQPQGGPLGSSQYLNANPQMGPFSGANGNAFSAGLNGPGGFPDTGFGSQSARMGFAHGPGAGMQLPHHGGQVHPGLADPQNIRQVPNRGRIREVWKHNLQEEMATLRDLVDKYPLIAMVSSDPFSLLRERC